MIRFLTAGESHGPALTAVIEGLPAGLPLDSKDIQTELERRRRGYGRGGRMKVEGDQVKILAGVRHSLTLGSPVCLQIDNLDWERWQQAMAVETTANDADTAVEISGDERISQINSKVTAPRPGHADLAGALKYGFDDLRNVLERASARETAMRVAVGAVARRLLAEFDVQIYSGVLSIGDVTAREIPGDIELYSKNVEDSPVASPDASASKAMMERIDQAKTAGDSLGGTLEVIVRGVPAGLGSHVQWDRRLDTRLAGALMSIPAMKAVEIGLGFEAAALPGSKVHDPIGYDPARGYYHLTNHAGGIEGGMSNGEPIRVRLAMKPIPTLYKPLQSVDINTKETVMAGVERSDTCAVPAAAVVAEAMVGWVLAEAFVEKFGGDSLAEMKDNYRNYCRRVRER